MTRPVIFVLALLASPVLADDSKGLIAQWGEDSGSLAPEYAWSYSVTFQEDGRVRAEYCKGYAEEAPGCATSWRKLPAGEMSALKADLAALSPDLVAHPPKALSQDEMAIGGGITWGAVWIDGQGIDLPGQPREKDVARVAQVLKVLAAHTPKGLVDKAKAKAKAP